MAVTFTVCRKATDSAGFTRSGQAEDLLKIDAAIQYDVFAEDLADPDFDGSTVDVIEAIQQPGLPITKYSTYMTSSGLIIPYLVCRSKRGRRNPARRSHFIVDTTWSTGDRSDQQEQSPEQPPGNLADFAPKVETNLGEDERVVYSDQDNKDCLTPNGHFYDEPFVERVATEIRRVTQYEPSLTYAAMRGRKFKTNSTVYRGEPVGSWLMTQVEAHEVQVELAGGPAIAVQVSYTMALTDRPGLWNDRRGLVDSHYKDEMDGDKLKRFTDDNYGTPTEVGRVDAFGYRNAEGQDMEYGEWRIQPSQDFNSFLLI